MSRFTCHHCGKPFAYDEDREPHHSGKGGPEADADHAAGFEEVVAQAHSVTVTITRGVDGLPLVFVDTEGVPDTPRGPDMRIRLNDGLVWNSGEPCRD